MKSSAMLMVVVHIIFLSSLQSHGAVTVEIEGVSDEILKNVLGHITLSQVETPETIDTTTTQQLHEMALEEIPIALAPFGYYNSTVEGRLEQRLDEVVAVYSIELGTPVTLQRVAITLEGSGQNSEELQRGIKKFPLQAGQICNQQQYDQGKDALINLAFGQGYLDATFATHSLRINRDSNEAIIELVLQTGDRYHFGTISSDQKSIRPELFQAYSPFTVGAPYKIADLLQLQTILNSSGYFGQVRVRGLVDQTRDYSVPIEVETTPLKKKNQYSLGAGYATDTGAKVRAGWKNWLLNSSGHKATANASLAELEQLVSFTYYTPLKRPLNDTLLTSLSARNRKWEDTDTELFSLALIRSSIWDEFSYDASLALRKERYKVGVTSGDSRLLIPSLNVGLAVADDLKNLHQGYKLSFGILGSVDGLISDTDFLQLTLDGKFVITPATNWRLICRGALGTTLVDDIDLLPPSLRFYTGGDNTIRGYDYKSIGSLDESGAVIGGRYLVIGSVEVERALTEQWAVAAFSDVGTATDDLEVDFFQGAGAGIRFRLPFGHIRLDAASAISEPGQPWRIHFTFGGSL